MTIASIGAPTRITSELCVSDEHAAFWIARAILRLRREVCWCWRLREGSGSSNSMPPIVDAAGENLDLVRYESEKARFFTEDPAAQYLTVQLEALQEPDRKGARRGGWGWLAEKLALNDASQFLLALVLANRLDAAIGPILATCVNDPNAGFVTLAAAQRLWDDPLSIAACANAAHPLFRTGILFSAAHDGDMSWRSPIEIHAAVACQLADANSPLPAALRVIHTTGREIVQAKELERLADYLRANPAESIQLVPVIGSSGTDFESRVAAVGVLADRTIAAVQPAAAHDASLLSSVALIGWLRDFDLLLPESWAERPADKVSSEASSELARVPIRAYVPSPGLELFNGFPAHCVTPPLEIAPLTFAGRVALYHAAFPEAGEELRSAIDECSRRYRFPELVIHRIIRTVRATPGGVNAAVLRDACRTESKNTMGTLAQLVLPRFDPGELVLPPRQQLQIEEILHAMRTLTEVHYHWGTAKAWNESGLTVLFAGPPGTGKGMGAEVISTALDLPMYRIDLSQVVNKYIGETEKNLKRIFDAAERSDCILFFDEADALFGKRTEVKDAHDRFANIEISYLLERMERFKGLAILATNRKKDMDEAFWRRLRFVVEFPLPGVAERERIWRQVFPGTVNVSDIDFTFLARQFSLTGGHIRSIAFAACLQSAAAARPAATSEKAVAMQTVLLAVKRELEKMNRAAGEEIFGAYGETMRGTA